MKRFIRDVAFCYWGILAFVYWVFLMAMWFGLVQMEIGYKVLVTLPLPVILIVSDRVLRTLAGMKPETT